MTMNRKPQSPVSDDLRSSIDTRLASLNREMGRTSVFYSDEAERLWFLSRPEQLAIRARAHGVEELPGFLQETADQFRAVPKTERLTEWEFRSTRHHYNQLINDLTSAVERNGLTAPRVVIVEGPTGTINAHILRDEKTGTSVSFIEEGLLSFGFQMLKVLLTCLPVPEDPSELRFSRELAVEHMARTGSQRLRLFELICYYLVGDATTKLQPYPLHPSLMPAMGHLWSCMEMFVVAHEFAHALHHLTAGEKPVFKEVGPIGSDKVPMDVLVLMRALADHPEHMRELDSIVGELQADFEGSDIVGAINEGQPHAIILLAPLIYLEFVDLLEHCLFRLSYGRDAARPAFTGNPSPAVRKAYLLAQMEARVHTRSYHELRGLFDEIEGICDELQRNVGEQMHVLWANGVTAHPRWRKAVVRMKPVA